MRISFKRAESTSHFEMLENLFYLFELYSRVPKILWLCVTQLLFTVPSKGKSKKGNFVKYKKVPPSATQDHM